MYTGDQDWDELSESGNARERSTDDRKLHLFVAI